MTTKDIIRELAQDKQAQMYSTVGEVIAVDTDAMTCDVQPVREDEAVAYGVRLNAAPGHRGLHLVPTVGSTAVITWLSKQEAYAALISELDYALIDVGETKLRVDADGILLQRQSETLRGLLLDLSAELRGLVQQVSALTVTCAAPGTPSSPPINAATITPITANLATIETRLKNLLSDG